MHKGVIFDCDGVLVDSERVNNEVFAEMATLAGVPTTFADSVARYMGRSTTECVADLEAQLGRPLGFDFPAEYQRRTLEVQRGGLPPVAGVRGLLDRLAAAGTAVCVASSGTPEEIEVRLDLAGLTRYFGPHCYSAAQVRRGKPAPDLFLLAAAAIGVEPTDCVLIEDSSHGVRGGRAAGMTVIGFAALAAPEVLSAAGADHIATGMDQVATLLGCV